MGKYLYIEGCHQCRHYSNKSGIHSCHMSGCAGDLPNYPKIPNKCRLPDALDNTQQRIQPIAGAEEDKNA